MIINPIAMDPVSHNLSEPHSKGYKDGYNAAQTKL